MQTIATILTLGALLLYVRDTWRIANLQAEELGLRKQPVISIHCIDPYDPYFRPAIINLSNVHAEVWVEILLNWAGIEITFPPNSVYTGKSPMTIQARGVIEGNPDIENVLHNEANEEKLIAAQESTARRTIDFRCSVRGRDTVRTSNPPVKFYWKPAAANTSDTVNSTTKTALRAIQERKPADRSSNAPSWAVVSSTSAIIQSISTETYDSGGRLFQPSSPMQPLSQNPPDSPQGKWIPFFSDDEIES
jgi:hypothetical protein